jgi:glycerol-3-phosphate O-acyltransferase/dihydroxyacetone phosphate acyltransferase
VYSKVWDRLAEGGAIGIFPEGGSHDNPHLLPLKVPCIVFYFYLHEPREEK